MNYSKITSRSNEHIKQLARLKKSSQQKATGYFLVEGDHLVEMAIEAEIIIEVLTTEPDKYLTRSNVIEVNNEIMEKLSNLSSPPSVIGVAKFPVYQLEKSARILYLDDVQDPGNVGTLIRTALAFGFDGVLASPASASFYSQKTLMAAQGASFKIPCLTYSATDLLANFKSSHTLIATALDQNAQTLAELEVKPPFILLLGSEGQGLNQLLLDAANEIVYLKIDQIDSLNVAAAGAILLYHLRAN